MKIRAVTVIASVMLVVGSIGLVIAAPAFTRVELQRTTDRDDIDAGLDHRAMYACEFGDALPGIDRPALGCAVAFERAVSVQRFEDALRYASIGCERYRLGTSCRAAARVPLYMGNASMPVPQKYAAEIRRLAQFVCHSGERVTNDFAGDVTARECSNLARHFILARDPEYRSALRPAARRYFEAAFDAALAARLYASACTGWTNRAGCEQFALAMTLADAPRDVRVMQAARTQK